MSPRRRVPVRLTSAELTAAIASGAPASPPAEPAPRRPRRRDEEDFTANVIKMARWYGWRVTHSRPARLPSGRIATPVQGHNGFPDLVLARATVVIFAELKTDTGQLSADQKAWLAELGPAAVVWRPRDIAAITETLSRPARPTRKD